MERLGRYGAKIGRIVLALPLLFTTRLVLIVLFLLVSQARTGHINREQLILHTYKKNCYPYRVPYRVLWLAKGESDDWRTWREVLGCM